MTESPPARPLSPRRVVAVLAGALLLGAGAFTFTGSAGAQQSYPVIVPVAETSAQTCTSLGAILVTAGYLESAPTWTQAKIDPPVNGSDGPFTVSNMDNSEPPSFDWSSTQPMNIVFVKSGSGASQIYFYNPATGATSGTGLTTANGKQVSNIVACYGTFASTTTTTEATTTTTEATTTTTEATTTTSSVLGTTTISTPGSTGSVPTTAVSPTTAAVQAAEVLGTTQASGQLPYTGLSDGWLFVVGAAVLLGGTALVVLARRRLT